MTTTAGTTSTARKTRCFNLAPWQAMAQPRITLLVIPVRLPQPRNKKYGLTAWEVRDLGDGRVHITSKDGIVFDTACGRHSKAMQDHILRCPLGSVGDVLIGREAWSVGAHGTLYRAKDSGDGTVKKAWYPASKMPQGRARFRRPILSIAVKQAQTITEAEARASAIERIREVSCSGGLDLRGWSSHVEAFTRQWDRDHPAFPWSSRPWAWFVELEPATAT